MDNPLPELKLDDQPLNFDAGANMNMENTDFNFQLPESSAYSAESKPSDMSNMSDNFENLASSPLPPNPENNLSLMPTEPMMPLMPMHHLVIPLPQPSSKLNGPLKLYLEPGDGQWKYKPEPLLKCQICRKDAFNYNDYEKCLATHLKQYPCEDATCRLSFDTLQNAEEHFKTQHPDAQLLFCGICGSTNLSREELKQHTSRHKEDTQTYKLIYRCHPCNETFLQHSDFITHMGTHRTISIKNLHFDSNIPEKILPDELRQMHRVSTNSAISTDNIKFFENWLKKLAKSTFNASDHRDDHHESSKSKSRKRKRDEENDNTDNKSSSSNNSSSSSDTSSKTEVASDSDEDDDDDDDDDNESSSKSSTSSSLSSSSSSKKKSKKGKKKRKGEALVFLCILCLKSFKRPSAVDKHSKNNDKHCQTKQKDKVKQFVSEQAMHDAKKYIENISDKPIKEKEVLIAKKLEELLKKKLLLPKLILKR